MATITNSYGVYIASPPFVGATVSSYFGLYQADPAAKNYFAGNVGIARTDPRAKLHVAGGDIFVEGAGLGFVPSGGNAANNVLYRGGTDFTILRNYNQAYTILQIWAPSPANQNPGKEATLALVRGDEPNQEYLDLYNNGYSTETQYGIRIQKRGTGQYRDFVVDQHDGTNPKGLIMVLKRSRKVGIGIKDNLTAKLTIRGIFRPPERCRYYWVPKTQ